MFLDPDIKVREGVPKAPHLCIMRILRAYVGFKSNLLTNNKIINKILNLPELSRLKMCFQTSILFKSSHIEYFPFLFFANNIFT